ncbi:MAG: hypothetical protein IJS80_05690 [Lachnospiraceae bacterium]|nr:hypothetical protein [Lachnospiraceae bacterium]
MKCICFDGVECEDIVMHFAKLLKLSGIDVAINDTVRSYSFSNIPLIREEEIKDHPGVLLINGMIKAKKSSGDINCLVTDIFPATARRFERDLRQMGCNVYDLVLIRDICGKEKAGDYIMNLLKIRGSRICLRESVKDTAVRCCLQEGIQYRLKNLSPGMRKGLMDLGEEIMGLNRREMKKAMGKEKKWARSLSSDPTFREQAT